MATTQQPRTDFVKAISRLDATALVVGSMIGSGIFIVSADILPQAHDPRGVHLAQDVSRDDEDARRSEEHTPELQSRFELLWRVLHEVYKSQTHHRYA